MTPCRRCGARATGQMHVDFDDGIAVEGRLRTRKLRPARRRVPNSSLCAACFQIVDEAMARFHDEHVALLEGGFLLDEAAEAILDRVMPESKRPRAPAFVVHETVRP